MNFSKIIFFVVIITYFAGIITPIVFSYNYKIDDSEKISVFLNNLLELNNNQLLIRIIKNNLSVIALNIIGAMTFGVLTFITTFYNGFILSFVVKNSLENYSYGFVLKYLLPHSIEIIAVLISCYLGIVMK